MVAMGTANFKKLGGRVAMKTATMKHEGCCFHGNSHLGGAAMEIATVDNLGWCCHRNDHYDTSGV